MIETNRKEYKRELNSELDIEKEVIAFLNYHEGGEIYIGIDKEGNVLGVKDVDGDMLKIKDRIRNNIAPSAMGLFDVLTEEFQGKSIIKINIASGSEKPYFKRKNGMSEKGCFMRIGTASEPMPQQLINKLFASRTRNSIGKIKSPRQDLSFEQLRIYYEEKGKPLNKQFKKNLELLNENSDLNYAAYLLSDENNISIKLAKYNGLSRTDLIESNEYGYSSLVKVAKNVLDKIDIENTTLTKITSKERNEQRLWHPIALREAIINAFVHSDFTNEVPPKFEIFVDRIEITSAGSLPEGLSISEFFDGFSIPRNKELMRIFKDLELVEQLGSGIPRILEYYNKNCFQFSDNFLRITFYKNREVATNGNQVSNQVGNQVRKVFTVKVTGQTEKIHEVLDDLLFNLSYKPTEKNLKKYKEEAEKLDNQASKILEYCQEPRKRKEILEDCLGITNQSKNFKTNVEPLIKSGLIELTVKDRPQSQFQKYFTSKKGKVILFIHQHKNE